MYYFFTASTTYTETAHILCLQNMPWNMCGFNMFTFCRISPSSSVKSRDILSDMKIRRRVMGTMAEGTGNKKEATENL